jgi:hypothetical protein
VRPEGLGEFKKSTSWGLESATVRLTACPEAFTYGCGKYECVLEYQLSIGLEKQFFTPGSTGLCPGDTSTIDFLIFIMEVGRKMRNQSELCS